MSLQVRHYEQLIAVMQRDHAKSIAAVQTEMAETRHKLARLFLFICHV